MFIYVLVSGFFGTNPWKFCFFANKPLKPCFSHIFFVSTPFQRFLRSRDPSNTYNIFITKSSSVFTILYVVSHFVHVSLVWSCRQHVVRGKSRATLRRRTTTVSQGKASGLLPLYIPFCPNNSMIIHFTLLLNCINLMGHLLRTLPSLLPQNLEHRVWYICWVEMLSCLTLTLAMVIS